MGTSRRGAVEGEACLALTRGRSASVGEAGVAPTAKRGEAWPERTPRTWRVARRIGGLGVALSGCLLLSQPAAAQAGAAGSHPPDTAVATPPGGASGRSITIPAPVSSSVAADSIPGAARPSNGQGTPPSVTGDRSITTEAAVGGTVPSDSIPAFAPSPAAAAAAAAAAAPVTPAEDSAAKAQRLALMYPTTVTVPLDRVAAVVGDEPILWSDVIERINVDRAQGMQVPTDSAGQMLVARNVTNELINEELLVQKAKELKVDVTDDDVMPAVDEQVKRVRATFSSDQEFRDALKKAGFGNAEEYRKTLIESQKRQELQRKVIQKIKEDGKLIPVGVSEADITQAFNTHEVAAAPSAGDRHLPADRHHAQADG